MVWREVAGFFAALDPATFRVPGAEGLGEWFEQANAVYRDDQDKVLFVAELDGVLVGQALASLLEPLETAERQVQTDLSLRRLHVDGLAVTAAHRRGGIGTALMEAVQEWGRSRGAHIVLLETEPGNPLSVPFYEQRMGFRAQAVVYRKELA